jgi:hypothetical protein
LDAEFQWCVAAEAGPFPNHLNRHVHQAEANEQGLLLMPEHEGSGNSVGENRLSFSHGILGSKAVSESQPALSISLEHPVADKKDLAELEADIEHYKKQLREDLTLLNQKIQATREQLSPTKFIKENVLLLCGVSYALGCVFGYIGVPLAELAKPAVRTTLTTAGKHAGNPFDSREAVGNSPLKVI